MHVRTKRLLGVSAVFMAALAMKPVAQIQPERPDTAAVNPPEVANFFYHASIGEPIPGQALAQVPPPVGAEDAKMAASRFAYGAMPALVGRESLPEVDWVPAGAVADVDGGHHVRLQQTLGGFRVWGAEAIVHLGQGLAADGVNGEVLAGLDVDLKPTLSVAEAEKHARVSLNLGRNVGLESAELVVYNPAIVDNGGSANYLGYAIVMSSPARDESYTVLVEADEGKLLTWFNNIEQARNRATYDLRNATSPLPGIQCHSETAPVNGSAPHADCLAAHNFAGDTYNYFSNTHGRDSWDGNGATMITSIRYGTVANAFWNSRQSAYGPGFATRDVVGHEWTHAVVGTSARLIYQNQSGALNEGFADVFGAMIDRDDWLMGEDTPIGALRSLSNPPAYGDPDRIGASQFYCGTADNGGVHTNSGVLNKSAYLMSDGGTFNGRTISGIGRAKAEKIFYRALTTYLTAGSGFNDAYNALNTSCSNLVGQFGITSADCTQAQNALQAVEMNAAVCGSSGSGTPDSFEDDDVAARASTYASAQNHTFHDAGDYDWVRFTVGAGGSASIRTSNLGSSADTVVRLYGTNGTSLLAENDDGAGGLASLINYSFTTAGTYFVMVRQYNPGVFGANTGYTLTITSSTTTTGDVYEPDNGPSQASTITVDGTPQTNHNFGTAGDNDWARFTVASGTTYTIRTENLGSQSDTYVYLYESTGQLILAYDDDGGGGLASRITYRATFNGTLLIRVRHFRATATGPNTNYDLRVTSETATLADAFEPDNLATQARALASGTPQDHNFHAPSDFDWVNFTATAGTIYTIETSNLQSRSDTVLELFNSSGVRLAINDDTAGGLNSRIVYTAPAGGTLLVRVRQYSASIFGANTGYRLSLGSTAGCTGGDSFEPDNSIAEAQSGGTRTELLINAPARSHNHFCPGDIDYVRFTAQRNLDYDFRTLNLGTTADTVMTLFDTNGTTVLAVNDDSGGTLASRIVWRATGDGTYFLGIRHYTRVTSGATTSYQLQATSTGVAGGADAYEDDDTAATSRPLAPGFPQTHNFDIAGDQDWMHFPGNVSGGSPVVIETGNLGAASDTVVEVLNGSTRIGFDDDSGGGLASRVAITLPSDISNVKIRVFHYSSTQSGANTNYDIRVTVLRPTIPGDLYEDDDAAANASTITPNGPAQLHDYHDNGDLDWIKFTATANTTYTIVTFDLGPTSDTYLDLFPSATATTPVASNDDGGGGLSSRIVFTPTTSGDLFIRSRHYSSSVSGTGTRYLIRVGAAATDASDVYEPDNTPQQASVINVGTTGQPGHRFGVAGDNDWARFTAVAGTTYIIETRNLGIRSDTVVDLWNDDVSLLYRRNDDFGGTLASRIEFTAPASGTYRIRVFHYSPSVSGADTNYDLFVTEGASGCANSGDLFEPDNSPAAATNTNRPLVVGTDHGPHNFGCAADHDWMRLANLTVGSRYVLETVNLGSGNDTVVTLVDSTGTRPLIENDDFGGTLASRLEFVAQETAYWVRVRHFSSSATGTGLTYTVRATQASSAGADQYEADNTASTASNLTPGTSTSPGLQPNHNHHTAGDLDFVRFVLSGTSDCLIETYALGSRSDTVVHLLQSDGTTEIAVDDDGGDGLASRLARTGMSAGTYFLKIRHYSSSTGGADTQYGVRLACGTGSTSGGDAFEPDNTPASASTITVNGPTQRHTHHVANDQDWARVALTGGQRYIFDTLNLVSPTDTWLYLYGPDGTTMLANNDDSNGTLASTIIYTPTASGTYFLMVREYSPSFTFGPNIAYDLRARTATADERQIADVRAERVPGTSNSYNIIVRPLEDAAGVKVETDAKPTLLGFRGARALASDKGEPLGVVGMLEPTSDEAGHVSMYLSAKNVGTADLANTDVVALGFDQVGTLPQGKTSVNVRVTLIGENGEVAVETTTIVINSINGLPRIDAVTPTTITSEAGGSMSITGSDFVATPKVFLVAGGQAIELRDIQLGVNGTEITATVPAGTKGGIYKVRVENPDGNRTDSDTDFNVTEGGSTCGLTLNNTSVTISGAGGTATVNVTTGNGCSWTAVTNDSFLSVTSAAEGSGNGSITITATTSSDGTGREGHVTIGGQTLTVTQPVNRAPTVSAIANQTINQGSATGAIAFTVGDEDGDALTITASSTNTTLVPDGAIVFGGSGNNRTITITPAATQSGTATITVTLNDGRTGTATTSFSLTVNAVPPGTPGSLAATVDGNIVDLAWSAPTSGVAPTGYRLEAGTAAGQTTTSMDVTSTTPAAAFNLPARGTWFVRVKALNGTVAGTASNEVTVIITGAPSRPQGFVVTTNGNVVSMSWQAPATGEVSGYFLDAGTAPGSTNLGTFPMGTNRSFSAPVGNGAYYVRLRAVNQFGSSRASNEVPFAVGPGIPVAPNAPTGFAATASGATVTLSWTAPTTAGGYGAAASYIVEAGFSAGATALTLPTTGTSASVPNVPTGRYFVRVRAVNAGGQSLPSNEVVLIVGNPVLPPDAPAGLTFTVGANRSVTLNWAAPSSGHAPTGYMIEAGTATGQSNIVQLAIGNTTTFSAAGVPPGTYFVRVKAFNSAGTGPASNEVTIVVP